MGSGRWGPMVTRLEGNYLVSEYHTTKGYVFDVPFGNLNEHCHGVHGKLPIALISLDQGKN